MAAEFMLFKFSDIPQLCIHTPKSAVLGCTRSPVPNRLLRMIRFLEILDLFVGQLDLHCPWNWERTLLEREAT